MVKSFKTLRFLLHEAFIELIPLFILITNLIRTLTSELNDWRTVIHDSVDCRELLKRLQTTTQQQRTTGCSCVQHLLQRRQHRHAHLRSRRCLDIVEFVVDVVGFTQRTKNFPCSCNKGEWMNGVRGSRLHHNHITDTEPVLKTWSVLKYFEKGTLSFLPDL